MLEMQAVLGRIQLARMTEWAAARKRNAEAIWAACSEFAALRVPGLGCTGCSGDGSRVKPGMTAVGSGMTAVGSGMTAVGSGMTDGSVRCARKDSPGCEHAHYKCYAYVQPERLAPGWSRDRIVEAINAEGVPCYQGSCSEVYLEKAFDGTGWRPAERLPVARELGETSIMFLVHPTLTQAEVDRTCEVVRRVMGVAGV
jgi:dTDP-4-amino-4,6-dideoxygalactose transaminase